MKRIFSAMMMLAMVFAAFSFISCSSDDDNNNVVTIIGAWECVSVEHGLLEGQYDGIVANDVIKFNPDNKYTISGQINDEGTWSMDGNKLKLQSSIINSIPVTFFVDQLDSKNLILRITDDAGVIKYTFNKVQLK